MAYEAYKSWKEADFIAAQDQIKWNLSIANAYFFLLRTAYIDVNPLQPVTDIHTLFLWDKLEPFMPEVPKKGRESVASVKKPDGSIEQILDIELITQFCLSYLEKVNVQVANEPEVNSMTASILRVVHDLIR
jgi:hypothetical protein